MPAEHEGGGESGQAQPYEQGGGYTGAHRGRRWFTPGHQHPASAGRDIGGQANGGKYDGFRADGRLCVKEDGHGR